MKVSSVILTIGLLGLLGCAKEDSAAIRITAFSFDFSDGNQGWEGDFTDYPFNIDEEADSIYHWEAKHVAAPAATGGDDALMLSCDNLNGDIFMFIKGKIPGLQPSTNYNVVFEIRLHSNAQAGQGIILKAGTSDTEPRKVIEDGYYVLNIDKGLGTASGENAISFGDIGSNTTQYPYSDVTKGNSSAYQPFIARTNSNGELWVILGVDSYYQGLNTVYFTNVEIVLSVSE